MENNRLEGNIVPEKQAKPSAPGRLRKWKQGGRIAREIRRGVEVAVPVLAIGGAAVAVGGCTLTLGLDEQIYEPDDSTIIDTSDDASADIGVDIIELDGAVLEVKDGVVDLKLDDGDDDLEIVDDMEVDGADAEVAETTDADMVDIELDPCNNACAPAEECCEGACVVLDGDENNCGACGTICSAEGTSSSSCIAGACAQTCSDDRKDCNLDSNDGCEVESATDINNCGACGTQCGGGDLCLGGSCTPCDVYYPNDVCDSTETYQNAPQDCALSPAGQGCFDGICAGGTIENEENCPSDCPTICGDGICGAEETTANCGSDCSVDPGPAYCGDGVCGMMGTKVEDIDRCPSDCDLSGDGICGPLGNCETDAADCDQCAPSAEEICG